mgnify:CR=1 FL=1|jgi:peptide deformylase
MALDLVYYNNSFLRQKSKEVDKIDDEIIELVKNMIETMDQKNGVGISAVQVGKLHRIFVIRPEIETPDGEFALGPAEVFINPKLTSPSKDREAMSEGCLSMPGAYGDVLRPKTILVEATNLKGERFKEEVSGFKAREIMHENDHLNGVMFIDRLEKESKSKIDALLKEIHGKYN